MKIFNYFILLLFFVFWQSIEIFSQENSDTLLVISEPTLSKEAKDYLKLLKSKNDSLDLEDGQTIFQIGYVDVHMGNNKRGNEIMEFVTSFIKTPTSDIYHAISVQNTKNGNYQQAVKNLDKAVKIDSKVYGYYGWVMLYYYRDYKRALKYLEIYDSLTPNFTDYPLGENIDFLKGLALMNLNMIDKAIVQFEKSIEEVSSKNGEDWVEISTFYYNGICYQQQKKYEQALLNYKKAIKYDSIFPEVNFQQGLCYIELNKLKEAKKEFLTAKEFLLNNESKTDVYMEIFNPVYLQDIEQVIRLYNL